MKRLLALLAVSLIIFTSFGFAAANPLGEVTSPGKGIYWKSGAHDIVFRVSDSDAPATITADIYYSTAEDAKQTLIAQDWSLTETGRCTPDAEPFSTTKDCTYSWDSTGIADGNYFIVIEVFDEITPDSTLFSSKSFKIDNTINISMNNVSGDTESPYWAKTSGGIDFNVNTGEGTVTCKWNPTAITDFATQGTACVTSGQIAKCSIGSQSQTDTATGHTFYYMCRDLAQNLSASNSVSFGVDYTKPDGSISTSISENDVTVTYSGSDAHSGISKIEVRVDDGSWVDRGTSGGSYTFNDQANGDRNYMLRITDNAGNTMTIGAVRTVDYDDTSDDTPSKPVIQSDSHDNEDEWYTEDDLEFEWDDVEGEDVYRYALNDESDYDLSEETDYDSTDDTDKDYSNINDGVYWFHLAACNDNGCSATDHYRVRIDKTGPRVPGDIYGLSQSDGSIYLSWSEPEDYPDEDNSGVSEYIIYRSITRDFDITDAGVRKFDDIDDTHYTDEYNLTSGIAYYYKIQAIDALGNKGTMSAEKRVLNSAGSCGISINFDMQETAGEGDLEIYAEIESGKIYNAKLKVGMPGEGLETIETNLEGSSISKKYAIEAGFDGKARVILEGQDENGKACEEAFEFEVDSVKPEAEIVLPAGGAEVSGETLVRVSASDGGTGIDNVQLFVAGKSVGQMEKNGSYYELEWNSNSKENGSYTLEARAEDEAGNTGVAEISVTVANEDTTLYAQKQKTFPQAESSQLSGAGLKESLLNEAMELIQENTPVRKLVAKRTANGITAQITVTLKNSGSAKSLSIVEVVPKGIAGSAGAITSANNFTVLEEDPVIRFDLGEVAENGEASITYTVGSGLSDDQAAAIAGAFDSFTAPPIVLKSETEAVIEVTPLSDTLWLVFIAAAVIFILLVIAGVLGGGAFMVHKMRKKGSGPMSEGIHTAYKKESGGVSDFFRDILRDEKKEKQGKFAYREK